jgi:hypothetical protein
MERRYNRVLGPLCSAIQAKEVEWSTGRLGALVLATAGKGA